MRNRQKRRRSNAQLTDRREATKFPSPLQPGRLATSNGPFSVQRDRS